MVEFNFPGEDVIDWKGDGQAGTELQEKGEYVKW